MRPDDRRRPRPPNPAPEERARRVLVELHRLGRALASSMGASADERIGADPLVLPVPVRLDPVAGGPDAAEVGRLVRDLSGRVDEALRGRRAFRTGRVHCFQCDVEDCGHDRPTSPADTFLGYSPTGKPVWGDFANLLLERRDPRVDLLYAAPPEVVAIVMDAAELTGELLPGFGRGDRAFDVLGQVVAGLVPVDLSTGRSPASRAAMTLQVVQTRGGGESRRLRLNLLGLTGDEIAHHASIRSVRGPAEWLRRAVADTRARLEAIGRAVHAAERRGQRPDVEAEVAPMLRRLATDLERVFRHDARRTAHGRERHLEGERPTATAMRDARETAEDRFLHDAERDTLVVLGPRGRAHVFTRDGRHVTSMVLGPGEVDRKFVRSRWRPMSREAVAAFRETLRSSSPQPSRTGPR
jgi:hypothetical protein